MPKGQFRIEEGSTSSGSPSNVDKSYTYCIFSMLAFFVMLLITLVVSSSFSLLTGNSGTLAETDVQKGGAAYQHGSLKSNIEGLLKKENTTSVDTDHTVTEWDFDTTPELDVISSLSDKAVSTPSFPIFSSLSTDATLEAVDITDPVETVIPISISGDQTNLNKSTLRISNSSKLIDGTDLLNKNTRRGYDTTDATDFTKTTNSFHHEKEVSFLNNKTNIKEFNTKSASPPAKPTSVYLPETTATENDSVLPNIDSDPRTSTAVNHTEGKNNTELIFMPHYNQDENKPELTNYSHPLHERLILFNTEAVSNATSTYTDSVNSLVSTYLTSTPSSFTEDKNKTIAEFTNSSSTVGTESIIGGATENKTVSANTALPPSPNLYYQKNESSTPAGFQGCPTMEPKDEGPEICETDLCKAESIAILSKMNFSFDYCQDFHEYACGGMRQSRIVLEEAPNELVLSMIKDEIDNIDHERSTSEKNLKKFYDSCLQYGSTSEQDRINKGRQFLNSVGSMYTEESDVSISSFTELIKTLLELGSFPIFDISLGINDEDANQLVPTLTLTSEDDYLFGIENDKEENCKRISMSKEKISYLNDKYKSYTSCMEDFTEYYENIAEALSAFLVSDKADETYQIQNIQNAVEETLIALYKQKPKPVTINRGKSIKEYITKTVLDLQSEFSIIDWKYLLSSLLNEDIHDYTKVQVYFQPFFVTIFNHLSNEKILWKVYNALLAHFAHNIYRYFVKPQYSCQREKYCTQITSRLIPDITSELFMNSIDEKTLNEQEKEVKKWHQSIRNTLLEEVNEVYDSTLNWMDADSLDAITQKINSLKISLPRPFNRYENHESFEQFYLTDNYFSNAMELMKRKQSLIYSTYKMSSNSQYVLWTLFSKSYSRESIYIYESNTLAIPEVILLKHNKKLPDAVTIARLGYVIAKGFTQALDIIGIEIDHENNKNSILTTFSYDNYRLVLSSFDMGAWDFKNSHIEDARLYEFLISTSQTLNNRFSDISATRLALETLHRRAKDSKVFLWGEFSKEQLYYVTLAQTFCTKKKVPDIFPVLYEKDYLPPFLRIRTMFSNTEEFEAAFPCAQGSPMRISKDIMIPSFPYLHQELELDYQ